MTLLTALILVAPSAQAVMNIAEDGCETTNAPTTIGGQLWGWA
jgi:hypothetical protein